MCLRMNWLSTRILSRERNAYSAHFEYYRACVTRYLRKHLAHHCEKNMFIASHRSPQRIVVRAIFYYFAATTYRIGNICWS